MFSDIMDDLEISLSVREQLELRREAETAPNTDPSLYTPWAILGPMDFPDKRIMGRPV